MLSRKKFLGWVIIFLILTIHLFSSKGFAKDQIIVGTTISTTGTFTFASSQGFKGLQVWVDDVNKRGGIFVKSLNKRLPIKLVYYDDRSDKETVVKLYEKLVTEDKVDICFAPFGSTLTGAAAAITEKHGKTLIIWSAAADAIYEQGYKYIVSATEVPNSLMPKPEVEHMAILGIKKMVIIYADEPFPAGMAKFAKSIGEKLGMTVPIFEKYSPGTKDFTILLQKAQAAKPEGFYASAYMDDLKNILRQMRELNIMFPYVYMVYSGMPQWLDLGDEGLYIFGHTLFHEDLKWRVNAGMDLPQFLANFNRLFPKSEYPPDFQTSLAYGAGVILEEMIKKAGSLEAKDLKQAALDLSGKLTVMTGPYEIDATGKQLQMPFTVTQVQKDKVTGKLKLVLLWPKAVATGEPVYPIPPWDK
ncbi:MAG: amino acid ABC transporter substrate-binding protein, partial [Thermodesulfobacteriota bacterium]